MCPDISPEVSGKVNSLFGRVIESEHAVEKKIADQNPESEYHGARIWSKHSRRRIMNIVNVYSVVNKSWEERHYNPGQNCIDKTPAILYRIPVRLVNFSGSHSIADNRNYYESHSEKKDRNIGWRIWMENKIVDNTHNQGKPDA